MKYSFCESASDFLRVSILDLKVQQKGMSP